MVLVSSFLMKRDQFIETRRAMVARLPVTGELLRGSLLERTVRHTRGCTICAGGGGHPLWVLTVGYPGGRTRQISLRREQIEEVRRWLRRSLRTGRRRSPRHHAGWCYTTANCAKCTRAQRRHLWTRVRRPSPDFSYRLAI
jgi:hypothetical protein